MTITRSKEMLVHPHLLPIIPQLSIHQLTQNIDDVTERYLSIYQLQAFLQPSEKSADISSVQSPKLFDKATLIPEISTTYATTCSLVWKLSIQTESTSIQALNTELSQLCSLWAAGKWHFPHTDFFQDLNTFTALQTRWQQPAIQASLRQITNMLNHQPDGIWIDRYPTCWAYAIGRTMHQLLQWNHQLTPQSLREFLNIDEGEHR